MYPDSLLPRDVSCIVSMVSNESCNAGGCKEVVLDAELVAIDRGKANELKSFQELSTRARGAIAASEVRSLSCCLQDDKCSARHYPFVITHV